VSIALAAVAGGMFEIGDDLPTLGASPERLSLVKNADLLDMARLGRASTPVDLMTYASEDKQPSIFLLRENSRQSILTIFNWTEAQRARTINFAHLGLQDPGKYKIVDVFGEQSCCGVASQSINVVQKPHSVRMLRLIDNSAPAIEPAIEIRAASGAKAGEAVAFTASAASAEAPLLTCRWEFGDGSAMEGMHVQHAYTHPGQYQVNVIVTGLAATTSRNTVSVSISGDVSTRFDQANKQRPE
jgi:alpha-galactosidase